jgi:hypothetical protein
MSHAHTHEPRRGRESVTTAAGIAAERLARAARERDRVRTAARALEAGTRRDATGLRGRRP